MALRLRAVLRRVQQLHFARAGDDYVRRPVLVTEGVPALTLLTSQCPPRRIMLSLHVLGLSRHCCRAVPAAARARAEICHLRPLGQFLWQTTVAAAQTCARMQCYTGYNTRHHAAADLVPLQRQVYAQPAP